MIIIVGAPRSGTTLLGKILSSSPSVHYFEEPNVIWRYKNWRKLGHEEFQKQHASAEVKTYIRNWFLNDKKVSVEKTPANALRLEFVREVFPEAKFIFLYRNSEDVVRSMKKKWLYEEDKNGSSLGNDVPFRQLRLQSRRFLTVPTSDKPYYIKTIFSELLFQVFGKKRNFWGPQYSGYKIDADKSDVDYICYKLWTLLTSEMIKFSSSLPAPSYIELTYEQLVSNPLFWINKLSLFCNINDISFSVENLNKKKNKENNTNLDFTRNYGDFNLNKLYRSNCKFIDILNDKPLLDV
ncbi:sulfotransferase family protein [Pseudoalteromonas sp. T1lg122]|uniref:sulfotransferase family protein n=1 Tax=Pseudoalteromonas sp. T1lg122 TaxID=2077094 RepID=UPI000CF6A2DE|nr:sulfotransferase [Pseudoalteromonas sp. T1lg122]